MMGIEEVSKLEAWAHRLQEKLGRDRAHDDAVRYTRAPRGIAAPMLAADRHEILMALVREYLSRLPPEVAEVEERRLDRGEALHFAWAGGMEKGEPHYYRIQSERFLIEYDNTQNDANHIHSVWRHPGNDFASDILARHYAHSHDPADPHHHSH